MMLMSPLIVALEAYSELKFDVVEVVVKATPF